MSQEQEGIIFVDEIPEIDDLNNVDNRKFIKKEELNRKDRKILSEIFMKKK